MATSSSSGTLNISLTSTQLYWLYAFLTVGDVVLAYVAKILPASYGISGLGAIAIAFFGTVAHDYTTAHSPSGVPSWVSYIVITVAGAVVGAIGYFTGDTVLTVTAFVAWLIVVLSAIVHVVSEDAGANLPTYAETVITTVLGAAIAFLTWYGQNPTATVGAIIATLVSILASYVHVSGVAASSATTGTASATA